MYFMSHYLPTEAYTSQAVICTEIYFLTKQQHAIFSSDQKPQMLSINAETTYTFLTFLV
jgi:hypothetical protein